VLADAGRCSLAAWRAQFFDGIWHFPAVAGVDFGGHNHFDYRMKPFISCLLGALIISGSSVSTLAQTNEVPAAAANHADRAQATLDKHFKPIQKALNLNDADKEAKVKAVFADYLTALGAWHAQNDSQLKGLWIDFNKAHGKMDVTNTAAVEAKLDAVYATFKPEHDKFLAGLSNLLTPEQVENVEDALTINKVKITYNAYQQIFHGLTPEQNAFILKNLKLARAESIDAGPMTETSALFKKYKVKIEAYLTAQGYDVKQSYKDFVAKQKADKAAKTADH
jgi:hypothetical protein